MTRVLVLVSMLACVSGPPQTATPDTSDQEFEKSMASLVEQLVSWLPEDKKPLVAVLDLEPLSGTPTDLERFLGEELTSRLFATRRANVVERAMLKKVFDELKRSASPAMDPHAASRLGSSPAQTTWLPGEPRISGPACASACGRSTRPRAR